MEFLELARLRFSVREYLKKDVENDKIIKVLEAARVAPSAKNMQPWHFIVVKEKRKIEQLHSCYEKEWLKGAPVIIVACVDYNKAWRRADGKSHADIDIAIAITHMSLEATDLGLGTCWVCRFDAIRCATFLKLPENIAPIAMLPIGYPSQPCNSNRHGQMRKSLNEIVHWEEFSQIK